jgi:hypothetical protein
MLGVAAIAGGGLLAFSAPAQAQVSFGNSGILTGNQYSSVVQVPISVCGNAIAVLGFASASCRGGATAINYNYYGGNQGPMWSPFSRTWS